MEPRGSSTNHRERKERLVSFINNSIHSAPLNYLSYCFWGHSPSSFLVGLSSAFKSPVSDLCPDTKVAGGQE